MPVIDLPYGYNTFNSNDLKAHIKTTGLNYIIQGHTACSRANHPKPKSLDCWLRDNYARNPDTMQAVNEVIESLLKTGDFKKGKYTCPESGHRCKGIELL